MRIHARQRADEFGKFDAVFVFQFSGTLAQRFPFRTAGAFLERHHGDIAFAARRQAAHQAVEVLVIELYVAVVKYWPKGEIACACKLTERRS